MNAQANLMKTAAGLLLAGSLLCSATEFRVKPGDGSFEQAAKKWKPGDTIVLAPGEYHNSLYSGNIKGRPSSGGLTIRAAIPGTAIFRGDREAPKFTDCGNGIWKAECKKIPETVFERDTFTVYRYCGTVPELQYSSRVWTWDEKTGTLYIRTSDSGSPEHHYLTIGVTPKSCISFYSAPRGKKGVRNILLEGFLATGYYSRIKADSPFLPHSQKKVPWGVVISHTQKNVRVSNVTAFLNGIGIGFCGNNAGGIIENCRAFGNWNPYCHSGDGIGIFNGTKDCIIRDCMGADNLGNDIFLYTGPIEAETVFTRNRAYGQIRVKALKKKGFAVTDCIADRYSHLTHPRHLKNSTAFAYVESGINFTGDNLLFNYEKTLSADKIYADPENFDCRLQSGVPESVAKRAPKSPWTNKVYFVKSSGKDSAGGRSVSDAFGTLKKAQEVLQGTGADLYIIGPVQGDLILKGLKDAAVRGRGKFPAGIKGKIVLENCENVTLERLMPDSITVRGGKKITVSQSTAALTAENTEGLRLTHCHLLAADLKDCRDSFMTANVFEKKQVSGVTGWSDYNAYAAEVPADEKHSFQAKAEMGQKGTFRNAWLFDGRAIDGMPVGPFRRQLRDVEFKLEEPQIGAVTPNSGVITLKANLPFSGELYWGKDSNCSNKIVLANSSCTHHIGLSGLEPDRKYYYRYRMSTPVRSCFSNAELKQQKGQLLAKSEVLSFTSAKEFTQPKEYFVSNSGNDSAPGSADRPFATISRAVEVLRPGDTLTIRGGNYAETVNIPVSGTKDHPITIRGAKGEKVRLSGGNGNALEDGFRIINQSNLIFENLNMIGEHMNGNDGYISSPILAVNAENLTFRRLIIGGGTHRILARESRNVLVEDCVISNGHEGLEAFNTSITIRNCVFAFGGVNQITLRNGNGEKCVLENCIIFDMLNMKGANPIVHVHDIAAFTERNNCFHTRFADETKRIYGWNVNGREMAEKTVPEQIAKFPYLGRCQVTYGEYLKRTGRERSSFFANPGIKIYPDFKIKYPDLPAFLKAGKKKNEQFSWEELRYGGKVGREEFSNYLPTDPEVIKRGCGPRVK